VDREWIQLMKVLGIGVIVTGYAIVFISEYREWEEIKRMKGGRLFPTCKRNAFNKVAIEKRIND